MTISPPFLLPTASTTMIAQERSLLGQLHSPRMNEVFQTAGQLQAVYARQVKYGGVQGNAWLSIFLRKAAGRVARENLYDQFLHSEGNRTTLRLPTPVTPPLGLSFSGEHASPAVIALETSGTVFTKRPLYFSISDLFIDEPTVRQRDIEAVRTEISQGKRRGIAVTQHLNLGTRLVRAEAAVCRVLFETGFQYVLGWIDHQDIFKAPTLRISDVVIDDRPVKPRHILAPIPPAEFVLGFEPRRDLNFAPRVVTLVRQGRPYPLVIEQQDFEGMMPLASGDALKELTFHRNRSDRHNIMLMSFRNPNGILDGFCINTMTPGEPSLFCDRSFKIDRDPESEIKYFGLAITMARLQFLKETGRWQDRGAALTNFIPQVTSYYRSLVGLPRSEISSLGMFSTDSVSFQEGEEFLKRNPLQFNWIS